MSDLENPNVAYMLSFLAILVADGGGEIVIEKLSTRSGSRINLTYVLDKANDRVTLKTDVKTSKEPPPDAH